MGCGGVRRGTRVGTRATGGGRRIRRRLRGEVGVSGALLLYCKVFEPDLVHSGTRTGRYDGGCCGVVLPLKVSWPSPPVSTKSVVVAVVVAGEKEKCGGPAVFGSKVRRMRISVVIGWTEARWRPGRCCLPACYAADARRRPPTLPPDQRSSPVIRSKPSPPSRTSHVARSSCGKIGRSVGQSARRCRAARARILTPMLQTT